MKNKMSELDEIRKRKIAEIQARQNQSQSSQANEEAAFMQQVEKMESMVKPYFSKEALQRYSNLRLAHPEQAVKVLLVMSQGIQSGKLKMVTDEQLKSLLREFLPKKRDISITRR
ncbi:MAG: DNA-binding protein [Nanoarchaeota archaeon]|nr:DNA-binding protein [Nanoarchaeota archaeon]